jgi:hypothetical protein
MWAKITRGLSNVCVHYGFVDTWMLDGAFYTTQSYSQMPHHRHRDHSGDHSSGLEENDYNGTSVLTTQTHSYNLAGHLISSPTGATTTFYMADGLDSVLTAFGQAS